MVTPRPEPNWEAIKRDLHGLLKRCRQGEVLEIGTLLKRRLDYWSMALGGVSYQDLDIDPGEVLAFYKEDLILKLSQLGKYELDDAGFFREVYAAIEKGLISYQELGISAADLAEEKAFLEKLQESNENIWWLRRYEEQVRTREGALALAAKIIADLRSGRADFRELAHWERVFVSDSGWLKTEPGGPQKPTFNYEDFGTTEAEFVGLYHQAYVTRAEELLGRLRNGYLGYYDDLSEGLHIEELKRILVQHHVKPEEIGSKGEEIYSFRHPDYLLALAEATLDLQDWREGRGDYTTLIILCINIEEGVSPEDLGLTADELAVLQNEEGLCLI